jgi:hypothetical protein
MACVRSFGKAAIDHALLEPHDLGHVTTDRHLIMIDAANLLPGTRRGHVLEPLGRAGVRVAAEQELHAGNTFSLARREELGDGDGGGCMPTWFLRPLSDGPLSR